MAIPPINLDIINEASKELEGESDRAAAIVGASLLDNLLESILKKGMIDHKEVKQMFKAYGPLSTFKSRINMSFLLGLLPHEKIFVDLDTIRDIRNKFAHGHKELTFEDSPIKESILELNLLKTYRRTLDMYLENELEEQQKEFYQEAKTPRKMWEVATYSISMLLSQYEKLTEKPTLKTKKKMTLSEIEND